MFFAPPTPPHQPPPPPNPPPPHPAPTTIPPFVPRCAPPCPVCPPQVFCGRPFNAVAADLWSLAMTLFIMLFGCASTAHCVHFPLCPLPTVPTPPRLPPDVHASCCVPLSYSDSEWVAHASLTLLGPACVHPPPPTGRMADELVDAPDASSVKYWERVASRGLFPWLTDQGLIGDGPGQISPAAAGAFHPRM
jgi:hypothetical protein